MLNKKNENLNAINDYLISSSNIKNKKKKYFKNNYDLEYICLSVIGWTLSIFLIIFLLILISLGIYSIHSGDNSYNKYFDLFGHRAVNIDCSDCYINENNNTCIDICIDIEKKQ